MAAMVWIDVVKKKQEVHLQETAKLLKCGQEKITLYFSSGEGRSVLRRGGNHGGCASHRIPRATGSRGLVDRHIAVPEAQDSNFMTYTGGEIYKHKSCKLRNKFFRI